VEMQDQIHLPRRLERDVPHSGLEQVGRIQQAREIVEDVLGVTLSSETGHRKARGLRFRADEGQVLTDERVQEAGLADIGRAGKGDMAGSGGQRVSSMSGRTSSLSGTPARS
jgi:hypothetical protein